MKKILLLVMACMTLVQLLKAQQTQEVAERLKKLNSDTIRYFQNEILVNKKDYAGKPLNYLIGNLPSGIKRYMLVINERKKQQIMAIAIYYTTLEEGIKRGTDKKLPLVLVVKLQTPLDMKEIERRGLPTFSGNWDTAIYNYLKDRIIVDIEVPGKIQ